jgi:tetratricopeptide (TPR) repeat protein
MIRTLLFAWLAVSLIARADDAADKLVGAGVAEFNAAYQAWDAGRFATAAGYFRQAGAKDPGSAVIFYWRGAALFHRMLQLRDHDPKAADSAMDAAMESLEAALDLDANHAESHALLGTLYGMKIHGGMLRAIRYGPSVQNHRKEALRCGPDNPRVRYLLGTCLFHTAKDDAGRRDALKSLLYAEKLFAEEAKRPAKPLEPRWGRSSCRTFIGRTYESLRKPTEAADYYRMALAEHPADHEAKAGLARVQTGN